MAKPNCVRLVSVPPFITVQVDTRERYPIPFPEHIRIEDPDKFGASRLIPVREEKVKLDIGDYRLKEFPDTMVVERKASQMELEKNLFDPRDMLRSAKAFRKLSTARYPYLVLESSPMRILSNRRWRMGKARLAQGMRAPSPEAIMNRLSIVVAKYGLNIIWAPGSRSVAVRRALGISLLHLMVGYALHGISDVPLDVAPE
jgi:ERCC4-type nuclease